MKIKNILLIILFALLSMPSANAQTPVANRIKAAIKHLPKDAEVVAKYTDNERHSLYYVQNNRLFCFDVLKNRNAEVEIPGNYLKILDYFVVNNGKMLFIAVDRGTLSKSYAIDGQCLYALNPLKHSIKEVGSGYSIEKTTIKGEDCFAVKKASRCLNPSADPSRQQWMAQDHYYDLTGDVIYAGDEFKIKIEKR